MEGRIPEHWKAKPAKLAHNDRDAAPDGQVQQSQGARRRLEPAVDVAIPTLGYPNLISIDRECRLIRRWDATDAAACQGARRREGLLDKTNRASAVWADAAYRSKANEEIRAKNGFVSCIHRNKPAGR
jgi:hypothetical protein